MLALRAVSDVNRKPTLDRACTPRSRIRAKSGSSPVEFLNRVVIAFPKTGE